MTILHPASPAADGTLPHTPQNVTPQTRIDTVLGKTGIKVHNVERV